MRRAIAGLLGVPSLLCSFGLPNRSLWTEHFVTNHADMGSSRRHADLNLTAMPRIDRR
jgi:hypothetical protein